jgi:hypothetical protein
LQKHNLGIGLQQCLYYRAVSQYLLGDTARGVADLERLYAVNASYPDVVDDKVAMQAGTFVLNSPDGPIAREGYPPPRGSRRQGIDDRPRPVMAGIAPVRVYPWGADDDGERSASSTNQSSAAGLATESRDATLSTGWPMRIRLTGTSRAFPLKVRGTSAIL